jgi:hypothetical protein
VLHYPSLSGAPLNGRLLALPTNITLGCKGFPGTKRSSLLQKVVTYGCKKFIALAPVILNVKNVLPKLSFSA